MNLHVLKSPLMLLLKTVLTLHPGRGSEHSISCIVLTALHVHSQVSQRRDNRV